MWTRYAALAFVTFLFGYSVYVFISSDSKKEQETSELNELENHDNANDKTALLPLYDKGEDPSKSDNLPFEEPPSLDSENQESEITKPRSFDDLASRRWNGNPFGFPEGREPGDFNSDKEPESAPIPFGFGMDPYTFPDGTLEGEGENWDEQDWSQDFNYYPEPEL